MLLVISIDATY